MKECSIRALPFLQKPFTLQALARKVRNVLHGVWE